MTQKKLKKLLSYNPETGFFIRLSGRDKGKIAGGARKDGYCRISINNKRYYSHRLAWLYMYGENIKTIDHINHNPSDNQINNLREVTHRDNCKNRKIFSTNSSGQMGVSWYKRTLKWRAFIQVEEKEVHLGYFIEYHEAVNVRKLAEVTYGYHKNHGKG